MRRRITAAIVGVAALILLALGVPLAIAVHRTIVNTDVVRLQAVAARTLQEIAVPIDLGQLAEIAHEPDAPPPFTVYDGNGNRVFGDGPARADAAVRHALGGNTASTTDGVLVVASPITVKGSEVVVGVVRVTRSIASAEHRSRVAWLIMSAAGVLALGIGWLIARRLARSLSLPVTELAARATRLGDGGTIDAMEQCGIDEIDTLATALSDSSLRINAALVRERSFSGDVSHQLRTPLTGLRLRLEAARVGDHGATIDRNALESALGDVTRIEQTVDHLLALARNATPSPQTVDLDQAVGRAVHRWTDRVRSAGRNISARPGAQSMQGEHAQWVSGSPTSVDQILDVLIDNAIQHGSGDIAVVRRSLAGGGAVDVADQGDTIADDDIDVIFQRGHGAGHGIGLALARSIAEAEGGRLLLAHRAPATFTLILPMPTADPDQNHPDQNHPDQNHPDQNGDS